MDVVVDIRDIKQEQIIEQILDAWMAEDIVLLNQHIFELAELRGEEPQLVSQEVSKAIWNL